MLQVNKTIYLLLVMVVCFALAGCSQVNNSPESEEKRGEQQVRQLDYDWPLNKILLESLKNFGQLQIDGYQVNILRQEGDYVLGEILEKESGEEHNFWAFNKSNNWNIIVDEEGVVSCEDLRKQSFPENLMYNCKDKRHREVFNFNDCKSAGFDIVDSSPKQCIDSNGNVFIEIQYLNQQKYYCTEIVIDCFDDLNQPVCGYDSTGTAHNYTNKCLACSNQETIYWIKDECNK